jgi:hypothetical protein
VFLGASDTAGNGFGLRHKIDDRSFMGIPNGTANVRTVHGTASSTGCGKSIEIAASGFGAGNCEAFGSIARVDENTKKSQHKIVLTFQSLRGHNNNYKYFFVKKN